MTAAISLIVLLVVLGSSIAVAAGMGLVGLILNQVYSPMPLTRMLGELTWSTTSNFILTAIPFYIMFGEILLRSGTAERSVGVCSVSTSSSLTRIRSIHSA